MDKVTKKFLLYNLKDMYYSRIEQIERLMRTTSGLGAEMDYDNLWRGTELAYKEIMRQIKKEKTNVP